MPPRSSLWNLDIWILWNMTDIVIFGWYCDIWLILWYLADILTFCKKKSRGRTGQEATLKQPRKQKPNFSYGRGPLAQPKQSQLLQQYTVKSLFRSVKFLLLPALFWVAFFCCKFSNQGFLLFHKWIITLHCLSRWQIYRRGYFSFQNRSTTKNDSTVSFFQSLPSKEANFVEKNPIKFGVSIDSQCWQCYAMRKNCKLQRKQFVKEWCTHSPQSMLTFTFHISSVKVTCFFMVRNQW